MEPIKEPKPMVLVSSSPHMHCGLTISKSMKEVMLALVPAVLASIYYFRMNAVIVMVTCMVSAIVFETLANKVMGKPNTISDGSAALTGLLLAMCLPPTFSPLFAAIGSFFAIVIGKAVFGGLGCNIFNPAHIGRAILLASFPQQMTTFISPVDGTTAATPLAVMRATETIWQSGGAAAAAKLPDLGALFMGNVGGSLGETCVPALVLGGLYLIYKKLIDWRIPVFYLLTVAILTGIYGAVMGYPSVFPLYHLCAGGLMIGAFFMATDWVTSPITRKGKIIYAIGLGVLTSLIRLRGSYTEGVCYSILMMNMVTPMIDRFVRNVSFGGGQKK
jgi:electron transport complex protein RnfD